MVDEIFGALLMPYVAAGSGAGIIVMAFHVFFREIKFGTKPRYEFDDGLVIHRLWVVNDKVSIAAIAEDFADLLNDTDYEDLVEWFGGEDEAYQFIKFYDEISDFSRYLRELSDD